MTFFLFGALRRFFPSANARSSRLLMNGVLNLSGINPISVSGARAQEFIEGIKWFDVSRDGTEVMKLMWQCHPDALKL